MILKCAAHSYIELTCTLLLVLLNSFIEEQVVEGMGEMDLENYDDDEENEGEEVAVVEGAAFEPPRNDANTVFRKHNGECCELIRFDKVLWKDDEKQNPTYIWASYKNLKCSIFTGCQNCHSEIFVNTLEQCLVFKALGLAGTLSYLVTGLL